MLHLTKPEEGAWISHEIPGSSGFQFLFDILAGEYTDAFSVDLVKVAVGGFSPYHIDPDNHAFYIVDGLAGMTIADLEYQAKNGEIVRIPKGVVHSIRNEGDVPLVMLVFYDPPRDRSALKKKNTSTAANVGFGL
jgi:mannose-6-phosphate isomerase-like protein (cupin superfamily)